MSRAMRSRARARRLVAVALAALRRRDRRRSRRRPKRRRGQESRCVRCLAVPRLPRADQGAARQSGKHKRVGCNACHDGTAAHLADAKKRADDEDRSRHLRRLPPEPVQVLRADGLAPHRALREEAGHRSRARSRVRSADDAARLHARAQPAALAHVHAARPVRRRSRVRRPVRHEGRLALSRAAPATSRSGTSSSTTTRTTPTRRHSSRAPPRRRIPYACRARRRTTSSTGRTWAIRCRARSGAARRRWSSSRSRRTMRSTASSATTRTPRSRGSSATR